MPDNDDIRAAFRALAERAPDAEGVLATITAPQPRTAVARDRHGRIRLLAPAAAAAAVLAVIGTLAAVGSGDHRTPVSASQGHPHLRNGVPRYYMALVADARLVYPGYSPSPDPAPAPPTHAVIRDTRTGAIVAVVRPPSPLNSFLAIAGAADDTTFVLAAARDMTAGHGNRAYTKVVGATTLFLARFNPATGTVLLDALPLTNVPPAFDQLSGLAVAANGSQIAVAFSGVQGAVYRTSIQVYSVRTGAMKLWQGTGVNFMAGVNYQPYAISWGPAGLLAFSWQPTGNAPFTVRMLNTSTAGGGLIADSRAVSLRQPRGLFYGNGDAMLSAAGNLVVVPTDNSHGLSEFGEYSAATGELVRFLWPVVDGGGTFPAIVLWTNRSGTVLAVYTFTRKGASPAATCGVIQGRRFTPIPGCPTASPNGWWAPMTF